LGFEYILKIGGTSVQLAIRAGAFIENILGSTDDVDDYLMQSKKGLRAGIGLKLGNVVLEATMSTVFTNAGEFDLSSEPIFFSLGFLF
ncbi:MAG: hypothetical protein K8S87_06295, partial [Planctomycetes bacterium]|nr:hypothetical protein [Planctomycetota bacterium]